MVKLYSINTLAKDINVSKNTLRKVFREKKVKDYCSTGSKIFFTEKQCEKMKKVMADYMVVK